MSTPYINPGSEKDKASWALTPESETSIMQGLENDRYADETIRQKAFAERNERRSEISFKLGIWLFLLVSFIVIINPYIAAALEIFFPDIFGTNYPAREVLKYGFPTYIVAIPLVISLAFSFLASVQSGVKGDAFPKSTRFLSWLFGGGN